MKLKIYVIKKQQLIWAVVILLIVIISIILLLALRNGESFNNLSTTKTYNEDIDNDGRDDSIVVSVDDKTNEYSMQVISSEGIGYAIDADPVIKTIGYNSESWPLALSTFDIDNDGISEIITQASDKKGPILHIFKYKDGKMERLASGRYSIFGSLKKQNSSSNIVMLGSKNGSCISISYLTTKAGILTPYIVPSSLTLGKKTLSTFVTYLEKKEVEACTINMDTKYTDDIQKGTFLDCSLIDSRYLKNYDIPSECTYALRSKLYNSDKENLVVYEIKMELTKYDNKNPEYRITKVTRRNSSIW